MSLRDVAQYMASPHKGLTNKESFKDTKYITIVIRKITPRTLEPKTEFSTPSSPTSSSTPNSSEKALLYLQGGPGFGCSPNAAWVHELLERGYVVYLMDQRGTGLSTTLTPDMMLACGDSDEARASFLSHFRADSIVQDAEAIRQALGISKWALLGQSFGGFCSITYLSFFPQALSHVFITGGLPPVSQSNPDQVYINLTDRVFEMNAAYFAKFPSDRYKLDMIAQLIKSNEPILLPNGDHLTLRRFQMLGIDFGFKSKWDAIHERLLSAIDYTGALSSHFKYAMSHVLNFNMYPIYAILHESIYCQGNASNWSAERVRHKRFDADAHHADIQFTGEMIFKNVFDDYHALRPLKGTASLLASKHDWSPLYNLDQLRQNTVPVFAALYWNDMYVDRSLSIETAKLIQHCSFWITNEFDHGGLRDSTKVINHLLSMYHDQECR